MGDLFTRFFSIRIQLADQLASTDKFSRSSREASPVVVDGEEYILQANVTRTFFSTKRVQTERQPVFSSSLYHPKPHPTVTIRCLQA